MKPSHLPYTDTKPKGAADFYFAINATFRFILTRLGREAWIAYLQQLGSVYYRPANEAWRKGGFPAIANYWRDFFEAEPESEVEIRANDTAVEIDVLRCPAIAHLKAHHREIVASYCEHCYHLNACRAEAAGYSFRLEGGNGRCTHRYLPADTHVPPQNLDDIREATSC